MKHANCVMIAFLLSWMVVQAQEVVSTAGSQEKTSSGSLSWTVGEPLIETITDGTNTLTQGFQQSKLTVTALYELPGLDFTISVFPNPVNDFLTVKVDASTSLSIQSMEYQLFDINGKLLLLKQLEGKETSIYMKHFKPSIYILKVMQAKDSKRKDTMHCISTFKIIKN